MKSVLGSLLCVILSAAQCFAISGGPPYPVNKTSLSGTYAGVLQPVYDPNNPSTADSLGVFTLGIPTDGASTGGFLMFARGRIFGGTIQGVTDPNHATVSALLYATYNYTLTFLDGTGSVQTSDVTASVTGTVTAKVTQNTNTQSQSSALLTGTADAVISNGGVQDNGDPVINGTLNLEVMGFKQSDTAPAAGVLTPPTGTGTG